MQDEVVDELAVALCKVRLAEKVGAILALVDGAADCQKLRPLPLAHKPMRRNGCKWSSE